MSVDSQEARSRPQFDLPERGTHLDRQLRRQWRRSPLTSPIEVRAVFYRERNVRDLVNFMEALADALEHAGVIENDRLVLS